MLNRKNIDKTKLIITIEVEEKAKFKKLCEDNNLTMTEVLSYTIKKLNEKGEIDSVDYRA